ncbi:MAG: nitrile hydratase subunit alpha [Acidimicrobiales bacterium]
MTGSHDQSHDHAGADSPATRIEALEDLLAEAGLLDRSRVDAAIERYENDIGPMIGARLVAEAWTDPAFEQRLLHDADGVIAERGLYGAEVEHLEVKANRPGVHNLVVCTLCSCYPWAVLGLPPNWYKSPEYRSRAVKDPRAMLAEMGLQVDPSVELRVWDSSSETRYMVLPERPDGTELMSVDQLAALVNRDSMIGVALADTP